MADELVKSPKSIAHIISVRAGNNAELFSTIRKFRATLSCILHDYFFLPPQPLVPGFLSTGSPSLSRTSLAFSSASSKTCCCCSCSSALTALPFLAPQPLPAGTFCCCSVPPALGLAPQLLPAWAPGRVTPPMLIKPAMPKLASIFFRSFFSIATSRKIRLHDIEVIYLYRPEHRFFLSDVFGLVNK
jgi:hypothetical protein